MIGIEQFSPMRKHFQQQTTVPCLSTVFAESVITRNTYPLQVEVVESQLHFGDGLVQKVGAVCTLYKDTSTVISIFIFWKMLWFQVSDYSIRMEPEYQQDHSRIHDSNLVQNWFQTRNDVELIDWPPLSCDMNPIENMWAIVTKEMKESWPNPPPATREDLIECVSQAWDDVCSEPRYVRRLINSMPTRMQKVVEADGFWTKY